MLLCDHICDLIEWFLYFSVRNHGHGLSGLQGSCATAQVYADCPLTQEDQIGFTKKIGLTCFSCLNTFVLDFFYFSFERFVLFLSGLQGSCVTAPHVCVERPLSQAG